MKTHTEAINEATGYCRDSPTGRHELCSYGCLASDDKTPDVPHCRRCCENLEATHV